MPLLLLHGRLWLCRWAWLPEAGVAAGKSQNQEWPFAAVSGCAARPVVKRALREVLPAACERASRARSHATLCVWRRRLPLHSLRRDLSGARHPPACRRHRRSNRRNRRAAAVGTRVLCCSLVPSAHGPHRSWTAAPCAQLLAAGVACDKWQIQKWPFATVSASVARFIVLCCCGLCGIAIGPLHTHTYSRVLECALCTSVQVC